MGIAIGSTLSAVVGYIFYILYIDAILAIKHNNIDDIDVYSCILLTVTQFQSVTIELEVMKQALFPFWTFWLPIFYQMKAEEIAMKSLILHSEVSYIMGRVQL